jgi:hypothetical protein
MGKVVIMHIAIVSTLMAIAAAPAASGVGTPPLLIETGRYSPIEKVACDGQGMFCRKGAALRCNPICTCQPCSKQARTLKPKR